MDAPSIFNTSSSSFSASLNNMLSFQKIATTFPFVYLMQWAPNIFPSMASGTSSEILWNSSSGLVAALIEVDQVSVRVFSYYHGDNIPVRIDLLTISISPLSFDWCWHYAIEEHILSVVVGHLISLCLDSKNPLVSSDFLQIVKRFLIYLHPAS